MFGMAGKMRVAPGKRSEMPAVQTGGAWITGIWDTEESHKASLQACASCHPTDPIPD